MKGHQRVVEEAVAPLVRVDGLRVSFGGPPESGAARGVSFSLSAGRCLAIVGESGSGKSVTVRSLVGLNGPRAQVTADRMEYGGRDVSTLKGDDWHRLRGKEIGVVLQDALVGLDPLRRVGQEVGEGLVAHGESRKSALSGRVIDALHLVGLPEPDIKARQYPHQLSGGQRQRALIAAALILDPKVLIADEPTTALDASVQRQIILLLKSTLAMGKALIVVSHDLAVVSEIADEVIVMRQGEVVEQGTAARLFGNPQHEYTRRLLDAVPSAVSRGKRLAPQSKARFSASARADTPAATPAGGSVLRVDHIAKSYPGPDGEARPAVRGVSFDLQHGETLGIVGESGSGKSTVALMAMAFIEPDDGHVLLHGLPWSGIRERERKTRRRMISAIYQDPISSFDPRWTVERILDDSLLKTVGDGAARSARVDELLDLVGLHKSLRRRHPLTLSGGQRQRVAIARAIAPTPAVIVCDEPVSALDASIQAQVLDLLGDLQKVLGVSYLFISHDLGVIQHVSDRVLVMSQGVIVESGPVDEVFSRPQHAYTQQLVGSVPRVRHVG